MLGIHTSIFKKDITVFRILLYYFVIIIIYICFIFYGEKKLSEEVNSPLKTAFEEALKRADKLPEQPTNIQLEMYGLYKQALFGNVTGERPGRMNVRARAKYDAWASRKDMSKETAMKEYIDLITKLEKMQK